MQEQYLRQRLQVPVLHQTLTAAIRSVGSEVPHPIQQLYLPWFRLVWVQHASTTPTEQSTIPGTEDRWPMWTVHLV